MTTEADAPPFSDDAFTLAAVVASSDLTRRMMDGDTWPDSDTPLGAVMLNQSAPTWLLEEIAAAVPAEHVTKAPVIAACYWVSWAIVLTRLGECGWPKQKPSILLAEIKAAICADDDDFAMALVGAVAESASVMLTRRGIGVAIRAGSAAATVRDGAT